MSLHSFEQTLLQVVIDALEACGLPTPDDAVVHQGPLPVACCTENGVLSVWWDEAPSPKDPCVPAPTFGLVVRWVTCWPVEEGAALDLPARAAAALRIADTTDCVQRALMAETCAGSASALFPEGALTLGRTTPLRNLGGCAGTEWRILATVKHPPAPPS